MALLLISASTTGAGEGLELRDGVFTNIGIPQVKSHGPVPTQQVERFDRKKHDEWIAKCSEKYSVPKSFIEAVIEVESNWDPGAVSSKGAIGLMQLMPETARILGVNPYDARQNIDGGTKYLAEQLARFNDDLSLALAAYNAGPTVVSSVNGIPDYRETRHYVDKVKKIIGPELALRKGRSRGAMERAPLDPADRRYDYRYYVMICERKNQTPLITNVARLKRR